MKSSFLNLELMHPNQIGKEILFNETIINLEQFCSQIVLQFIDHTYQGLEKGLYIISKEGDRYHNHLSYQVNDVWKYFLPQTNMIFFVKKNNSFFSFNKDSWEEIKLSGSVASKPTESEPLSPSIDEYIGISDEYSIPNNKNFLHLYISGNSNIKIQEHPAQKITLLIKQHHKSKRNITWGDNIIFTGDLLDLEKNHIAVLQLYKTPEDNRYLVNIVGIYK